MDASDRGLCTLFPAHKQFFQLEFDHAQRELIREFNQSGNNEFGINVRELMSVVYAALIWGSSWTSGDEDPESHMKFWIDNMSAVAWSNKRFSRNPFAQMLLRIVSLCEVQHGFFATASHVAGVKNEMADAGSRMWQSSSHALTFSRANPGRLAKSLASLGALLRAGALAQSTRPKYSAAWSQWVRWCGMMNFDPWLTEADVSHNTMQLGAYAVYLWQFGMNRANTGNSYSTICGKLCAIRWHHRNLAGYDPGVNASHAILLREIRRFTNPPTTTRKTTMVGLKLKGAKNNQFGREEVRYHHKSGDKILCPVRAARWIHRGARAFKTAADAPALSLQNGGITADEVATVIRRAAARLGFEPSRFSTHSVRIRGATALLNLGTDRLLIKLMGRWLSNAFEAYPVLSAKGSAEMSTRMC
ncbi:hypothetical protein F442_10334 [Phytophthora nicotianae P10297]|uniref:Tyr recombinase domain-containing protein n=2 Tax=Phytophthora nicotianae TaxID=4792 RepID=W2Z754_PHYNI|nr:hypothetical protein F442_10334 [Phytophthora nicotianae P10297]